MVTDSRAVTNADLGSHLTDALMSRTRSSAFLRALLDEAVRWRTSTGFWRDFLVDRAGAHRGQLDLKRGGLFPVVALGRWIAIVTGDAGGSTPDRLRRGADADLLSADERDTLLVGFHSVYTTLFDYEVAAHRAAKMPETYIRPRDLGTLARRHLRETLRAVAAVQDRMDQSWLRRLDHA
jgi:CBS domain-containing protein